MSKIKTDVSMQYVNKNGQEILNIAWPVVLASATSTDDKNAALSDLEEDFFGEDEEVGRDSAVNSSAEIRVIGAVQIGITLKNMHIAVKKAIWTTIGWGAAILAVGFFLAFWIGSVISSPIRRVVNMLTDISEGEGDLSQRIHIKSSDETGDLAAGFNTFMDKFQEIKKISIFLNELADGGGDLTKRLEIASLDEIGMLAKGFDRFVDKLHEIIKNVAANTGMISQASQTVSDTAVRLARELNEVARQSGEVANSSTIISQSIESTNHNVSDVNELMNATERSSAAGVDVVHEARTGMARIAETIRASSSVVAKLNESSQKIGDTITTITEIADQTKLIAINAAIEASRVGAQGKGFSVVAEEIRRLAARVTRATQEISLRIKVIREDADRVVDAMRKGMDEAGKGLELSDRSERSLENISGSVTDAKSRINQIAVSSSEQALSISSISRNINSISESAKQSSDGVSSAAHSMQELNKEVQELKAIVGRFILEK
jgi:methyl-accepting chemotaxis protein